MRKLSYLILLSIFCSGACQKIFHDEALIGVKIYDHDGDLHDLFEEWDRIGINLILASPELAGEGTFMQLARSYSMRVFLIVPTFYEAAALDKDTTLYAITREGQPAVDDWVRFICPNREDFRRSHLEYLRKLVQEIHPDGISLDFIRYFVYWEKVYPDQIFTNLPQTCFNDACIMKFCREFDIVLPDNCRDVTTRAEYILANLEHKWVEFKCASISSYVAEMADAIKSIDPSIEINFHAVPWRSDDFEGGLRRIAGQDLKMIAPYVNFISPMCYAHMVVQPPEWVSSVVLDFNQQVPTMKILPSIQVNKAYLNTSIDETEFRNNLIESLKPPSAGVIFWSWEALERSPGKVKIIRDYLNKQ